MFLAQDCAEYVLFRPCYMTCYRFEPNTDPGTLPYQNRSLCDNGLKLSVTHYRHKELYLRIQGIPWSVYDNAVTYPKRYILFDVKN